MSGKNNQPLRRHFGVRFGLAVVSFALATGPFALMLKSQSTVERTALHRLAVYRAEAARLPAAESDIKAAQSALAATPGLMTASNAQLAEAALQNAMRAIVRRNKGAIRSAQTLPSTKQNGFEAIAVQYDLVVPATHMSQLIYAVESHMPYLFIDHADISAPRSWTVATLRAAEPKVEIRWTVRAYRWVGAS